MDAAHILDELTHYRRLPVDAINAARADRETVVPIFLETIEDYLGRDPEAWPDRTPLFFIFHLLGEWRQTSAYRPLARLLRLERDKIDAAIGGAVTETSHQVIAAVFDGDPQPLYDVILDRAADEFVRSRMCEVLVTLVRRGDLPYDEVQQFLSASFVKLIPEPGCFVWSGWQSAVAALRIEALKPLAKDAFDRGMIDPSWLSYQDFEEDYASAADGRDGLGRSLSEEFRLFGDTIDELSKWYGFSARYEEDERRRARRKVRDDQVTHSVLDPTEPLVNPTRNVGRNDPCPCGSGKKYKKCCLN